MKKILVFLIFWSVFGAGYVNAQNTVQVPDLTGMNVPQAAAALNRVGLGLGNETGEAWTAASGLKQNSIKAQSVAAGQSAASAHEPARACVRRLGAWRRRAAS